MVAHAARSVGLNHGINAGGFEEALGEVSFTLRRESLCDDEVAAYMHSMPAGRDLQISRAREASAKD